MNNGIFASFDRTNSSDNKLGFSPSGQIQYEAMDNTLPRSPLSFQSSIDGIFHIPPAQDWKLSRDRLTFLIDTTRPRRHNALGYLSVSEKSFYMHTIGVQSGYGGRITIDWGDGVVEEFSKAGYSVPYAIHNYNQHGLYFIQIWWDYGSPLDGYSVISDPNSNLFRLDNRDNKCLGVLSFDSRATTLLRLFMYYDNLLFVPKILPPSVTSIESMFQAAYGPLNNVELWDTSNVTNMAGVFNGFPGTLPIFNKNLSNWNVSNVTDMNAMFINAVAFNNGGPSDANASGINNWDVSKVTNMSYMFGSTWRSNSNFNQPIGNWNVGNVTNMESMFGSTDGQAGDAGGARSFNQDISNWNVSKVTNMSKMFFGAIAFNNAGASGIGNWNTSACTNMNSMFRTATSFNQNIGNWDISKVTNTSKMFMNASAFNQNLSNWNMSGVTNTSQMFWAATAFNNAGSSGINNWNTSAVTDMQGMFLNATSFNQPIGSWNTSNVTSLYRMFQGATAFNKDIGNWNTSKNTSMNNLLSNQCPMNYSIGSWDVSKVTDYTNMCYANGYFNNGGSSSINNWTINISGNVGMQQMFLSATAFNQPIGNWNVSRVTDMRGMFQTAVSFNQDISSWNVSKVTSMSSMFQGASAFQGGLSGWNLAGLNASTSLDNFMLNKTGGNSYSTANYDALLIGWNSNKASGVNGVGNWRTDLKPNFGGAKYTAGGSAATARASLVTYGWTITDGGTA